MEFWQNIVLKWKQIQQFCLWALSSDPSGLVESGLYYNTTANRAALRDDTKTQFLAHLEDTYKNAGVVKQPTITKGAGSVTVGNDAIIRCYKTTDYSGIIQEVVNPTGGTFALTENTPLWLVYTYGVGYSVQTSITGPLSNAIPVYRFFNAFGVIHSSTQDEMGVGATEKILVKQTRTEYIKRVGDSGIELSTSALNVLISGGLAYNGPILETILPFNSATNNLYRVVYDDGVWSQTALHALTNTHYNPSTGLAALNSNKYCWAYVWRSIGNDVEALFQLGEQEYATEALAVADLGKMPANIYGLYATHCVLVGYVLIKQGVTTTQYFSAWGRPTVAGAPVYHNTLAGIDAGDPGTAYFGHVKLLDNTRMNAAGTANGYALLGADGKLPSGQLPSYVDDVLEYAAKANFPATGESGKIYVDLATNLTWRWSGTTYVEISPSLALGETSATAYRGDRGKIAYDHSQAAHAPANADNTQAALNAGASKTTPVDADTLALLDSAASNAIKKLSWANAKSTLKAYFDGIYSTLTLGITSTTAARGDQGKTAYDHSQLTASNPHGTTAAQIAFTPTGSVSSLTAQAAIAELDTEKLSTTTAASTYATIASLGSHTGDSSGAHAASAISCTATGDVGATDVQSAIAELASEKLAASTAATTYAPINTTLSDNSARSTLPETTSQSLVSKIQQVRDYLKYLLAQISDAQSQLDDCFNDDPFDIQPTTDLNSIVNSGSYRLYSSVAFSATYNQPVGAYTYGQLRVFVGRVGQVYQEYHPDRPVNTNARTVYRRNKYATSNAWTGWVRDVTTDDLDAKQNTLKFDTTPTVKSSNPVTSNGVFDALAGKSANGHTHDSITTSAGDANTPVYFSGGKPVACSGFSLYSTGGGDWAQWLYNAGNNSGRNIDTLLAPAGGFRAFVVTNPASTAGLPISTSWCYITEQVHIDNAYAHQTFTDYWSNRSFWRRKENGTWRSWSEYASTSSNVASASKLATARTIALTGDVTGSGSFDGSGNLSIEAAVADNSHLHTIANVTDLPGALDSKAPTSHASTTTTYGLGSATNYGHVRVDSTPTVGSGNAISSGAVANALDYKANQITLLFGSSTLPTNAPLATQVFVDGTQDGYAGATITAPSGEYITRPGNPGQLTSLSIGAYRGCWFVKSWSNRWTPVGMG